MNIPAPATSDKIEFYLADIDTHLLLEVVNAEITIRASRNNLSPRRKEFFVRELVAEGWICEDFRAHWINWVVDPSWLLSDSIAVWHRTRMFMVALIAGFAALWLALITLTLSLQPSAPAHPSNALHTHSTGWP